MKNYVAGLMFSQDKTCVALIVKNKPDWQKGLLNGIGGQKLERQMMKRYNNMKKHGKLISILVLPMQYIKYIHKKKRLLK